MSNTLTALAPTLFSAAKEVANEPMGALDSINLDFDNKGVAIGDDVTVPIAPAATEATYTPAQVTTVGSDKVAASTTVSIDYNKVVSWHLTGEQQRSLENGNTNADWISQLVKQGMRTLRNAAEARALTSIYQGSSSATGTAGTTPFSTTLDAIADLNKIMLDNGAPMSDMTLAIDTAALNNAQKLAIVQQADKAGSDEERRSGILMNQYGFKIKPSAGIASHTKGTMTGADCTAVEPVGETTIACDGSDSGTVLAGDVITQGNEGGGTADTTKYVVNSGSTLTGNASGNFIINGPGLKVATVAIDEWTIGDSYTANVAFERSAVVGVMRPPLIPSSPLIKQMMITDDRGLTYLFVEIVGDGLVTWRLHLAYGFKVVNPEFVATLLG